MASKGLTILALIAGLAVGIGVGVYLLPQFIPKLTMQTQIIATLVLTVFAFMSFYFLTKGSGG